MHSSTLRGSTLARSLAYIVGVPTADSAVIRRLGAASVPLLCIAEGCERFAASLLAALLALRLNEQWGVAPGQAARAVAWFDALCYGAGLGGAWLADRWLGLPRATVFGAALLALGYVALTVELVPALLLGLVLLFIGHALYKPSISGWVASVAEQTGWQPVSAMRWFYFAVNAGSVVGPLAAAGLRSCCGFSVAVGIAAGVMILAWLLLRLVGCSAPPRPTARNRVEPVPATLSLCRLARVWLVLPLFAAAMCQTTGVLLFWARDFTDLRFVGHTIPPESFTAVPAALVLLLSPVLTLARPLFRQRGGEPSESVQIAVGAGLGMLAYLLLLGARFVAGTGRVSPLWLLGCDGALTLGELLIVPATMAQLARIAQHRGAALAQSSSSLALALGSGLAGVLAAQWGHAPPERLFAALVLCCLAALALTLAERRSSRRDDSLCALDTDANPSAESASCPIGP